MDFGPNPQSPNFIFKLRLFDLLFKFKLIKFLNYK